MGSKQTTAGQNTSWQDILGSIMSQYSGTQTPTEAPGVAQFRNKLMPQIQQAISQAQQPVYGEAQKAGYLGDLDRLAKGSIQALQQNMARSGASNSGRMSQGLTDIGMNRDTQASQFFSQIPFLNRQATMSQLPQLFGSGISLAASAPRGMMSSGTNQQTTNQTSKGGGTSSQTTSSPWWSGLLGKAVQGAEMGAMMM